jgi:putative radical SAM enzyme (TIGR03279 family)
MDAVINSVQPDSIADDLDLKSGTRVIAINGLNTLEDQLDYQYHTQANEDVELHVKHPDGSEEIIEIEKDPGEDLGIIFERPIFTPIKTCNNACPFCFIDQQPDGLRPTLYVKDDDWRLSYFSQTYITLTNLTAHDRQRIEAIRPGPLYVSVHSTVAEVRVKMLANPKHAGKIMENLRWLQAIGVPFHAQVVICPGINDGPPLTQTLKDLWTLADSEGESEGELACLSVAVIPVGLTQHRDGLSDLNPVDKASAKDTIDRVAAFIVDNPEASSWVFCGDEFYHKAGVPMPSYDSYGEFDVLEDGVGTARHLINSFYDLEPTLPDSLSQPKKAIILTGKLASMTLQPIVQRLNEINGLYVDILTVDSQFWGQQVDVAGLITGQDIINACRATDISGYDMALIPNVMIKPDTDRFLDDQTINDVSDAIAAPITIVTDPYDANCLIDILFD